MTGRIFHPDLGERGGGPSAGHSPRDTVSAGDLERSLLHLRAGVDEPRKGLYGPDSKLWEVNREAVLFLGGGRAALLQLAHPSVADAIAAHSKTEADPWGRFRRTFRNVFAMVYGDLDAAFDAARRVHRVHQRITGRLAEDLGEHRAGDPYQANDPEALRWVHATLWDTSVLVFELIVRPLAAEEKAVYYQETRRFAALFGIEDDHLPRTWEEFLESNRSMWRSGRLGVGRAARETGAFLFCPRSPFSRPLMSWLQTMTAGLMPEPLRSDFGLRWGPGEQRLFERSIGLLRRSNRFLPRRLRYVPAYHTALRRLRGVEGRDPLGELLTRLWLGA
ncbi:MAG TPA: oxygenase MpaB family protein [Thermoanaerobaculia bacterium]|nr:oxygenase MpaB family protein [Thermoanaerobaculia bacterium]